MKNIIFVPSLKEARSLFNIDFNITDKGFYEGYLQNYKIIVSGVSKTNISIAATYTFTNEVPDVAYLVGIAGCYRQSDLNIGDVVCVCEDFFVDEGALVENNLLMLHELGFGVCEFNKVKFNLLNNLPSVKSNTVSFLSSKDFLADIYRNKTLADIENMEGASFGLVCSKFKVTPFQIRAISNYCGDRNSQEWNAKIALDNLKKYLYGNIIKI
ncbi:hypothetical protein LF845_08035 [Deferribacterales bacterium Es71-Z0220]|uniref:phosphorylase family protein n=1 Tax=Deferrivibrio essentukiensis TaxID=2880922 RepID=UPI001F624D33|nr:hypothetical protein [Deferrivibrio essentukiensis]MCB4204906.1 hypothetical protein [Deferrivibrio essentukiensis]